MCVLLLESFSAAAEIIMKSGGDVLMLGDRTTGFGTWVLLAGLRVVEASLRQTGAD